MNRLLININIIFFLLAVSIYLPFSLIADKDGHYGYDLTVCDINNSSNCSGPDSVTVYASLPNVGPNADAGNDQNVTTGYKVLLNGKESNDPYKKDRPASGGYKTYTIMEFMALLAAHIPSPYESLVYYYGIYSCSHRGKERKENRCNQGIEIQEIKGAGRASSTKSIKISFTPDNPESRIKLVFFDFPVWVTRPVL